MRKIIMIKVILVILGVAHSKLLQSKNYVPTKKRVPLYRRTQSGLFSSADDVEFHKNNARLLIFDIGNTKCSRSIPK